MGEEGSVRPVRAGIVLVESAFVVICNIHYIGK